MAKRGLLTILRAGLYTADVSETVRDLEAQLQITPAEAAESTAALGVARLGILGLGIGYEG